MDQRRDNKSFVIYYVGKTLNEAQANYSTKEKEMLAVVFVVEKFQQYLFGSKVIVYTDYNVIKHLMEKKDAKPIN